MGRTARERLARLLDDAGVPGAFSAQIAAPDAPAVGGQSAAVPCSCCCPSDRCWLPGGRAENFVRTVSWWLSRRSRCGPCWAAPRRLRWPPRLSAAHTAVTSGRRSCSSMFPAAETSGRSRAAGASLSGGAAPSRAWPGLAGDRRARPGDVRLVRPFPPGGADMTRSDQALAALEIDAFDGTR